MYVIRFQGNTLSHTMESLATYRRRSKGWEKDPPAYIHPRILFGAGSMLIPSFVAKHSITHVINCAFDEDSPDWFKSKFPHKYVCINAQDSLSVNIFDWYSTFEDSIQRFLADNTCETIYIHCQCGINRSGFLTLIYASSKLGFNCCDVFKAILQQRPCAFTNPFFRKQVEEHFNVSLV
jgi:Dual specificity phosphatase, catalytic domain